MPPITLPPSLNISYRTQSGPVDFPCSSLLRIRFISLGWKPSFIFFPNQNPVRASWIPYGTSSVRFIPPISFQNSLTFVYIIFPLFTSSPLRVVPSIVSSSWFVPSYFENLYQSLPPCSPLCIMCLLIFLSTFRIATHVITFHLTWILELYLLILVPNSVQLHTGVSSYLASHFDAFPSVLFHRQRSAQVFPRAKKV